MIKDIVKNLKPSSTLRINEISQALELEGKKVFKFGFGQSPFQIPDDVVDELKNNAYQNKYLPMQGLPKLRNVIAKHITNIKKYNYKDNNVIIGPGTKKQLKGLLNSLTLKLNEEQTLRLEKPYKAKNIMGHAAYSI